MVNSQPFFRGLGGKGLEEQRLVLYRGMWVDTQERVHMGTTEVAVNSLVDKITLLVNISQPLSLPTPEPRRWTCEWNSHGSKDRSYIWAQHYELILKKSNLVFLPLNTQVTTIETNTVWHYSLKRPTGHWVTSGLYWALPSQKGQQFIFTGINTYPDMSLPSLFAKPQPSPLSAGSWNS